MPLIFANRIGQCHTWSLELWKLWCLDWNKVYKDLSSHQLLFRDTNWSSMRSGKWGCFEQGPTHPLTCTCTLETYQFIVCICTWVSFCALDTCKQSLSLPNLKLFDWWCHERGLIQAGTFLFLRKWSPLPNSDDVPARTQAALSNIQDNPFI